ncbi:MAG: HAD family phosphatase [Bacteroidota bacterium]|nr:HAD family phosphatase [Bacteroidota bacterium]
MKTVKNIIFDLGGVIINIDPSQVRKKLLELQFDRIDDALQKMHKADIFNRFETGQLSPGEFRMQIKTCFDLPIEDSVIDDVWNSLLLDFPQENISLLKELKQHYRLYLLSNTNRIHYNSYSKQLQEQRATNFGELFVKEFYSFRMGLRKPGVEIYEQVLMEAALNPSETLFIDDTEENLVSPRRLGIQTKHIQQNSGLRTIF